MTGVEARVNLNKEENEMTTPYETGLPPFKPNEGARGLNSPMEN